jgi:low temperature requirement protein LtrA
MHSFPAAHLEDRNSRHPLLRQRGEGEAKVTNVELCFDLVYAFAVTQLSHFLLHELTPYHALQTLVLWFAVWLGWQYTCWVTNWFDPDTRPIRLLIFAAMPVALIMAAAIPEAFEHRGLAFAGAYVTLQVGRTAFVLSRLGLRHSLSANFLRMLIWLVIAAGFWIAGGFAEPEARLGFWIAAVLIEYLSPMTGFALPILGRSRTSDWTIEGGHLAERCQLFVIVALGETILTTGDRIAEAEVWSAPIMIASAVAFLGAAAAGWVYFGTSSEDGSHVIRHSPDPGRVGAYFHYVHVILIAGIIVMAAANNLIVSQPDGRMTAVLTVTLLGGPALYLIGSGLYKRVVYGCWSPAHIGGLVALGILAAFAQLTDRLLVGGLAILILLGVGAVESWFFAPRALTSTPRDADTPH